MLLSVFLLFLAIHLTRSASPCTQETVCSCTFENGTRIDLHGYRSSGNKTYLEVALGEVAAYRLYPCGVTEAWGDGGCDTTATACQYIPGDKAYYSLGQTDKYQVLDAKLDGDNSHLLIQYTGGSPDTGSGDRKCDITMECLPKGNRDLLVFSGEFPPLEFRFEFQSTKACPIPPSQPSEGGEIDLTLI